LQHHSRDAVHRSVVGGRPPPGEDGQMSDAEKRIGNAEREAAVAALRTHHSEGRIDSKEYEERALQAQQARTASDLDPLFADLPGPRPSGTPRTAQPAAGMPSRPATSPADPERRGGLLPEPWAWMITAVAPLLAVILFFSTGSWLWFIAIPIVGIVVYGPDRRHGH
jgi:Domain of unknown function (DUF1707)